MSFIPIRCTNSENLSETLANTDLPRSDRHVLHSRDGDVLAACQVYGRQRGHVTGEMTKATVVAQQLHRDQLADKVLRVELGVIGQNLNNESEIARKRFFAFEAIDQQNLVRRIALRKRERQ